MINASNVTANDMGLNDCNFLSTKKVVMRNCQFVCTNENNFLHTKNSVKHETDVVGIHKYNFLSPTNIVMHDILMSSENMSTLFSAPCILSSTKM